MFSILTPQHHSSIPPPTSRYHSSTRSHHRHHPHARSPILYCQFCQRRFTKPYNLMVHERSHFEIRRVEQEFVCDVCGKGWKSREQLREHRAQHSPGGSSTSSSSSSSSSFYFY